jgi:dTDP-4-dehydrorhamnose reductase
MDRIKVFLTGGSGTLGGELYRLLVEAGHIVYSPRSAEVDIVDLSSIERYLSDKNIDLVINCAAYTDVKSAEKEIQKCIDINIIGTANIVKYCSTKSIRLVHISTEHVFDGERGLYKVMDAINPISKYAKSKGAAELCARMYENCLVIRTSFFKKEFPYEKAFIDQWSSKDYIDIIAPKIFDQCLTQKNGIVHCVSSRRTLFEIAKQRKDDVKPWSRKDFNFPTPRDTSLEE